MTLAQSPAPPSRGHAWPAPLLQTNTAREPPGAHGCKRRALWLSMHAMMLSKKRKIYASPVHGLGVDCHALITPPHRPRPSCRAWPPLHLSDSSRIISDVLLFCPVYRRHSLSPTVRMHCEQLRLLSATEVRARVWYDCSLAVDEPPERVLLAALQNRLLPYKSACKHAYWGLHACLNA
jgi:hypothetical protein